MLVGDNGCGLAYSVDVVCVIESAWVCVLAGFTNIAVVHPFELLMGFSYKLFFHKQAFPLAGWAKWSEDLRHCR